MNASVANPQSPYRSVHSLGSFESGGSCGSRFSAGFNLANGSGASYGDLGNTFSSNGAAISDSRVPLPAGVAVTVLQPINPDDERQEFLGTLTDQLGQNVNITTWPALRLPFKIHHSTVLTLRLFKLAHSRRPFSSPQEATCEPDTYVGGVRIPVGILMSRGGAMQCWCALDDNFGATTSSHASGCTVALETFEVLRKRAVYEICPKVFVALRGLRADQLASSQCFPSPSANLGCPVTPAPAKRPHQGCSPRSAEMDFSTADQSCSVTLAPPKRPHQGCSPRNAGLDHLIDDQDCPVTPVLSKRPHQGCSPRRAELDRLIDDQGCSVAMVPLKRPQQGCSPRSVEVDRLIDDQASSATMVPPRKPPPGWSLRSAELDRWIADQACSATPVTSKRPYQGCSPRSMELDRLIAFAAEEAGLGEGTTPAALVEARQEAEKLMREIAHLQAEAEVNQQNSQGSHGTCRESRVSDGSDVAMVSAQQQLVDKELCDLRKEIMVAHRELAEKDLQIRQVSLTANNQVAEKDCQMREETLAASRQLAEKDCQMREATLAADRELAEKDNHIRKEAAATKGQLAEKNWQIQEITTATNRQIAEKDCQIHDETMTAKRAESFAAELHRTSEEQRSGCDPKVRDAAEAAELQQLAAHEIKLQEATETAERAESLVVRMHDSEVQQLRERDGEMREAMIFKARFESLAVQMQEKEQQLEERHLEIDDAKEATERLESFVTQLRHAEQQQLTEADEQLREAKSTGQEAVAVIGQMREMEAMHLHEKDQQLREATTATKDAESLFSQLQERVERNATAEEARLEAMTTEKTSLQVALNQQEQQLEENHLELHEARKATDRVESFVMHLRHEEQHHLTETDGQLREAKSTGQEAVAVIEQMREMEARQLRQKDQELREATMATEDVKSLFSQLQERVERTATAEEARLEAMTTEETLLRFALDQQEQQLQEKSLELQEATGATKRVESFFAHLRHEEQQHLTETDGQLRQAKSTGQEAEAVIEQMREMEARQLDLKDQQLREATTATEEVKLLFSQLQERVERNAETEHSRLEETISEGTFFQAALKQQENCVEALRAQLRDTETQQWNDKKKQCREAATIAENAKLQFAKLQDAEHQQQATYEDELRFVALDMERAERCAEDSEARLQTMVDKEKHLQAALNHQERHIEIEVSGMRTETEVANTLREDMSRLEIETATKLAESEGLFHVLDAGLEATVPEAQDLVQALLQQETNFEYVCSELCDFKEQEATDLRGREEIDVARGQLLASIESRVHILVDEIDQERAHFRFHNGHGSTIEAQFEELSEYTESRDQQFELTRAELKRVKYELQEERENSAIPQIHSAIQQQEAIDRLEKCIGQEQGLREHSQKELQAEQVVNSKLREDLREQLNYRSTCDIEVPDVPPSPRSAIGPAIGSSVKPALRPPKSLGSADSQTPDFGGKRLSRVTFEDRDKLVALSDTNSMDAEFDIQAGRCAESSHAKVPPPVVAEVASSSAPVPQVDVPEVEPQEDASRSIHIEIDRSSSSMSLGIEMNKDNLQIDSISAGGLVSGWNNANPSKAVHVGDRIQSVNGAQTLEQIIGECQELKVLRMSVVRNSGASTSSNSTPTRSVGPGEVKVPHLLINGQPHSLRQQSNVALGLAGTNERKPRDRVNTVATRQRGRMDIKPRNEKFGFAAQRPIASPNESPASSMSGISDTARPAYSFSGGVLPGKAVPTVSGKVAAKQTGISEQRNQRR